MSCVADMLISVIEKVMEKIMEKVKDKLSLVEIDDETWHNVQDWVMEHTQTQENFVTLSAEELANQFIEHNVCAECLSFTYGSKCSCRNRSEINE